MVYRGVEQGVYSNIRGVTYMAYITPNGTQTILWIYSNLISVYTKQRFSCKANIFDVIRIFSLHDCDVRRKTITRSSTVE